MLQQRFWLLISLALIAYAVALDLSSDAGLPLLCRGASAIGHISAQDMILVPLSVYNLDISSFESLCQNYAKVVQACKKRTVERPSSV